MIDLPKGWIKCNLNDVVRLINGDRGKNYPSKDKLSADSVSGLPFVSALNLSNGRIKKEGLLFLTERQYELLGSGKFQRNDIIFCLRGSLGKNAVSQIERGAIASSLVILRPYATEPLLRYIELYINSPLLFSEIKRYDNGTAQPNLSASNLAAFHFPLPPLAEQHCIVGKIESLFSKLDKGVETLQTIRQQLRTYRQAVLKWAFEGNVAGTVFSQAKVGDFIDKPKYGTSKKCSPNIGGTCVLRIPNINYSAGTIDYTDIKFADFEDAEKSTLTLQENDILVIRSNGSVSLVGRAALIRGLDEKCLFAGYLIRLRVINQSLTAKYLLHYLSSPSARIYIESVAKSTSGVNNINAKEIESIPLPICSLDEQAAIVVAIESRLSVCDNLESIIDENLCKAAALKQSILKKAFAGMLVPQDPNDEPAERLLERITAARTVPTAQKKPVGKRKEKTDG